MSILRRVSSGGGGAGLLLSNGQSSNSSIVSSSSSSGSGSGAVSATSSVSSSAGSSSGVNKALVLPSTISRRGSMSTGFSSSSGSGPTADATSLFTKGKSRFLFPDDARMGLGGLAQGLSSGALPVGRSSGGGSSGHIISSNSGGSSGSGSSGSSGIPVDLSSLSISTTSTSSEALAGAGASETANRERRPTAPTDASRSGETSTLRGARDDSFKPLRRKLSGGCDSRGIIVSTNSFSDGENTVSSVDNGTGSFTSLSSAANKRGNQETAGARAEAGGGGELHAQCTVASAPASASGERRGISESVSVAFTRRRNLGTSGVSSGIGSTSSGGLEGNGNSDWDSRSALSTEEECKVSVNYFLSSTTSSTTATTAATTTTTTTDSKSNFNGQTELGGKNMYSENRNQLEGKKVLDKESVSPSQSSGVIGLPLVISAQKL